MIFFGKDMNRWYDRDQWERFDASGAVGNSFEEMIVNLGNKFFKHFGNFTSEDFLTPAEKRNHEKQRPFLSVPGKYENSSEMVSNSKYKTVLASEINRRWVK
jgi:hypothetical protein